MKGYGKGVGSGEEVRGSFYIRAFHSVQLTLERGEMDQQQRHQGPEIQEEPQILISPKGQANSSVLCHGLDIAKYGQSQTTSGGSQGSGCPPATCGEAVLFSAGCVALDKNREASSGNIF